MSGTHAVVAVGLMIAVVAMAYGTATPQLGMAEFAPAARQEITAPPTTSAPQASAAGGRRQATTTTTASTTQAQLETTATTNEAPTTRSPRTRACVGSPARQTEDPTSPPCVAAIFEGDNGGATTGGVSSTEIRVAVPIRTNEQPATKQIVEALFGYFNSRYELYGRRLVPVYVASAAGSAAFSFDASPLVVRALATEIAATGVFAVAPTLIDIGSPHPAFYYELARQHLVTVTRGAGQFLSDEAVLDPAHPYLWSVYPSLEQRSRAVADFVCTTLAGRVASHAGDPLLRGKPRKFGLIAVGPYGAPSTRTLRDGLAACGVTPVAAVAVDRTTTSYSQTGAVLEQLESAGATTVICTCDDYFNWFWAKEAETAFRPEWLVPSFGGQGGVGATDESLVAQVIGSPPSRTLPFGLTEFPKLLPIQAASWFQALVSVLPDANAGSSITVASRLYDQLALLAAGIQGAGPALTPDTFAQALMSTQFPNLGAGQAPCWQPSVGFGPGDHSFYNDYALVSWHPALAPLDPSNPRPGSWCYVDRGARFTPGQFPTDADARFFPADPSSCR